MQEKALSTHALSLLNLKRKPFRTAALMTVVALLSFLLFGGSILTLSMKNGINSLEARLGADLIVVPKGYDQDLQGILVQGEPTYFFMDKSVYDQVKDIEGVAKASFQFYLASIDAECCGAPVPIIGFDPETDFTVQPWISEQLQGELGFGDVIAGNEITYEGDGSVLFYNRNYYVASRLEKTGSGLDTSCFATMDTIRDLYEAAQEVGAFFTEGVTPDNSISSVMIEIEEGYEISEVMGNIRRAKIEGIDLIKTQGMISSIGGSLSGVLSYLYIIAAAFWVMSLILLSVVFSVTANERKKEFALFRILGATRKRLSSLILTEALYLSAGGSVIGVSLAALIIFPFSTYIGDKMGIPYLQPSLGTILLILVGSLALSTVVGPLASAGSAHKISRAETYHTMREGE